jgi:hypothetical protein
MEEFFKSISNYGFPIVVAGYMLLKMQNTVDTLGENIKDLTNKIDDLIKQLERKRKI